MDRKGEQKDCWMKKGHDVRQTLATDIRKSIVRHRKQHV